MSDTNTGDLDMNEIKGAVEQAQAPNWLPEEGLSSIASAKVFAAPFHLVFKRTSDQAITWIEVKSVTGLKRVIERISKAELVPVNASATLGLQLWAHLAEYVGFLRVKAPTGHLNAGLEPLGAEQAKLVDDMSELFGGFEPALSALASMRNRAVAERKTPDGPSFLKEDGVNLTPEGERELASKVYDTVGDANVAVKMQTATAETLLAETDLTGSPIGDFAAEFAAQQRELTTITGPETTEIGRKIELAAEGALEDEEEVSD